MIVSICDVKGCECRAPYIVSCHVEDGKSIEVCERHISYPIELHMRSGDLPYMTATFEFDIKKLGL